MTSQQPTPEAVEAVADILAFTKMGETTATKVGELSGAFGWDDMLTLSEATLAFIRDALPRDGADADAIRQALGLRQQRRRLCTCGGDVNDFSHAMSERHENRAPERRVVGEWQEVQP